ncbi:MAG: circadian clock KaiB family protein [Planctomycetota bacterium JB042]
MSDDRDERFHLRLYVHSGRAHSSAAIDNIRSICDERLDGDVDLEVIDVFADPQAAELDRVLATPTLIRVRPEPSRRLVGDLGDRDLVARVLDLGPGMESSTGEKS